MGGDNRSPENIQIFVKWLNKFGAYLNPNIDIFNLRPDGEHGVKALSNIKENAYLLMIPRVVCLNVPYKNDEDHIGGGPFHNLANRSVLATINNMNPGATPFMRTVLLLMAEKALADSSRYAPYINILPTVDELNNMCPLTNDERDQLLTGTGLTEECTETMYTNMYLSQIAPLTAKYPSIWPEERCDLLTFQWAYTIVQSRGFVFDHESGQPRPLPSGISCERDYYMLNSERIFLIPALDMLNHSSFPQHCSTKVMSFSRISWFKLDKSSGLHEDEVPKGTPCEMIELDGWFTVMAQKEIPAQTEIYHSYGDLADSELYKLFGFVQAATNINESGEEVVENIYNPYNNLYISVHDMLPLMLAISRENGVKDGDERRDFLEAKGMLEAASKVKVSSIAGLQATPQDFEGLCNILTVLQVMIMSPEAYIMYKKWVDEAALGNAQLGIELVVGSPEFGAKVMALLKWSLVMQRKALVTMLKAEDDGGVGRNKVISRKHQCARFLLERQLEGLDWLLVPLAKMFSVSVDDDDDESSPMETVNANSENAQSNQEKKKPKTNRKKGGRKKKKT
jgi:SET domain